MQDGVGRNRDYGPTSGSIACCERQVQYTQLRRTMMTPVDGKRQSLLTVGDDDEVYDKTSIITRILNVVPTTTEQSLIVSSGNPSNNDKRLISRYITLLKLTIDVQQQSYLFISTRRAKK